MNAELMPVTLKLTTDEYKMLWERADDGDVQAYLLRRVRASLKARDPGDDRPRGDARIEEDPELAALRREGYRLMPRSVSPVKEFFRSRSCFLCDCLGHPKDWRVKGRFADYVDLSTDKVLKRAICEEHARKYGS